jgi:DNA-binding beta-propeller fold protein YncE
MLAVAVSLTPQQDKFPSCGSPQLAAGPTGLLATAGEPMLIPTAPVRTAACMLAVVVVFCTTLFPLTASAQNPRKPLSKDEVVELLKGGVSSGRVADIARDRGINFELTPEAEDDLRGAGATDELISTLQELAPKPTQIVVETSPDAQVYLDDTLAGQASSQGRLAIENPKPGDHTLRVSLAGRKDYQQPVTVVAGQVATVRAKLEEVAASHGTLRVVARFSLPSGAGIAVDVDPTTNKVFTSGGASGGQQVAMIDGSTNRVVATLGTGSGAHVNPATGKVYAGGVYSGTVYVYSSEDGHQVAEIKAFGCPIGAVVDSSSNQVWGGGQCGANDDPAFLIDGGADRLVSGYIGSGGVMSVLAVNPVTHVLYVFAGTKTEGKIDPSTLVTTTAPFSAVVSAVNAQTNRMYGGAISGGGVEVIDGSTESVIATLPASQPGAIAVNPTRNRVYVDDHALSPPALKVFDGATNTLLGAMPLPQGASPAGLAVNSRTGTLYQIVVNPSGSSLLVIDDSL